MSKHKKLHLGMIGWGMFLTGALSLSSCVNDEVDSSLETTGKAIGFSSSYGKGTWEPDQIRAEQDNGVQQVQSRGALTSTVNADWGYKVGAYYHLPNNGDCVDYFDENSTGGYTVSNSSATATTNYYWPPAGEMEFFAVAPHTATGLTVPTASTIANPELEYTIPATVADQKDIMVAKTANLSCPQSSAVNLQFQHLLAAVQFKAGEMENIEVTGITVSGVKGGKVTMTYDKDNNTWSYSNDNNNVTYSPVPRAATSVAVNNEITGNDNNSILLVMPQELTNSATLAVTFKNNSVQNSQPETKTVALTGQWVAGKITNYILNISPDYELSLTVAVKDWTPVSVESAFAQTPSVGQKIVWDTDINDDGTADYDIQNDEVILNEDINVPAKFTFQLTGPKGGEWIAYFVKEGGVSNAFTLNVEGDDSRDVTCQGKVGEGDDCIYTIEVRAKGVNNTSVTNKAELRFMIRQAGQLLPVDALTTLSGSRNYKILQNPPQQ